MSSVKDLKGRYYICTHVLVLFPESAHSGPHFCFSWKESYLDFDSHKIILRESTDSQVKKKKKKTALLKFKWKS